jgi:uncharacterized membrane protein
MFWEIIWLSAVKINKMSILFAAIFLTERMRGRRDRFLKVGFSGMVRKEVDELRITIQKTLKSIATLIGRLALIFGAYFIIKDNVAPVVLNYLVAAIVCVVLMLIPHKKTMATKTNN